MPHDAMEKRGQGTLRVPAASDGVPRKGPSAGGGMRERGTRELAEKLMVHTGPSLRGQAQSELCRLRNEGGWRNSQRGHGRKRGCRRQDLTQLSALPQTSVHLACCMHVRTQLGRAYDTSVMVLISAHNF